MTHRARPTSLVLAHLAPALLALGCGSGDEPPAEAAPPASARASHSQERAPLDPRLAALYAALDGGALDDARARLAALAAAPELGFGLRIAEARLAASSGRELEAVRLVERARALDPSAPEAFATAAEIHAGGGRFESAWSEVRRGEERCGAEMPELVRARGVLWISRPGGAAKGLALLEAARAADPGLPFLGRPLGQAHLLLAREALARGESARGLAEVERALVFDPTDVDARRLAADCRSGVGDLDGAVALLDELAGEGVALGAELGLMLKRAALLHLLEGDREGALERFARARAAGLDDEGLGSGAQLLAEGTSHRVDEGVALFRAGDAAAALERFDAALALAPDSLEAENHRAVALWELGRAEEAVDAWRSVVRRANEERLELPEPVHVHLARALLVLGEREGARLALSEHLERFPGSRWIDETRALLENLGAESAGAAPR